MIFQRVARSAKTGIMGAAGRRNFSASGSASHHDEHVKTMLFWKRIDMITFPACLVASVILVYNAYSTHGTHRATHQNNYDHLYIRTRKYPWTCGGTVKF